MILFNHNFNVGFGDARFCKNIKLELRRDLLPHVGRIPSPRLEVNLRNAFWVQNRELGFFLHRLHSCQHSKVPKSRQLLKVNSISRRYHPNNGHFYKIKFSLNFKEVKIGLVTAYFICCTWIVVGQTPHIVFIGNPKRHNRVAAKRHPRPNWNLPARMGWKLACAGQSPKEKCRFTSMLQNALPVCWMPTPR